MANMPQPLHPCWRDFYVAIVRAAVEFGDAAVAQGVQGVFEFPEGVALEVEANKPLLAPWEALHLPLVPCPSNWAGGARHYGVGAVVADKFGQRELCWSRAGA